MKIGDICFIRLPSQGGAEQHGDHPAIIMSKPVGPRTNPFVMIVPFTSTAKASTYQPTIKVANSPQNGLRHESIALIFQLRAVSLDRVLRKIGELEYSILAQVKQEIKNLMDIS